MSQDNVVDNKIEICDGFYKFNCPHCNITIIVMKNQLNCKIFRCGIYKSNSKPINPHASKIECDKLVQNNLIIGCGKPFIIKNNKVEICGYI